MIIYKEVDETCFDMYDRIPMLVHVKSKFNLVKRDNGLGGILLEEVVVDDYIKNLGVYEEAIKYKEKFDITILKI